MKSTNNYINQDDFEKIIQYIPNLNIRKWENEDIEWLFRICYHCALRMGEGVKLKKEDIDIERRIIFLGKTKTKKNDEAVIPKDFVLDLDGYILLKDDGPLFPGLTIGTVRPWLLKLGKQLNISAFLTPQTVTGEKTKCHIFRKSRGKDLESEGIKLSVIMNVFRHQSLNTTSKYLRNTSSAVKEVI